MSATLCAIMKNEAPYIKEWVAFHRMIGFDQIVIYENDSTDESAEILKTLAEKNLIKHVPWPSRKDLAPQRAAYADAVQHCATEWICFLDADEFLNLKHHDTVRDFLAGFSADVNAIAINWRIFGSSGLMNITPGLVTDRFTRASLQDFPPNLHCKTIARAKAIKEMHIHRCFLEDGRYVDVDGNDVEIRRMGFLPSVKLDKAQVNHYAVKSKEECDIKRLRGNANRALEESDKYAHVSDKYFASHDMNDVEDRSIQRFSDRLHQACATY